MSKFEYKFFTPKVGVVDGDANTTAITWANKMGLDGWHFFQLDWSRLIGNHGTRGGEKYDERYVEIFAKGCRKITDGEMNRFEYRIFTPEVKLVENSEELTAFDWANEVGQERWNLFELTWSTPFGMFGVNKQGEKYDDRQIQILAKGRRKIND